MSVKDILQAESKRLGFTLFGVAAPLRPPHLPVYERWLEQGLHASMAYLATQRARDRRADPLLILPEARSLLVAAMRYFAPEALPDETASEALGRVAAYAWGEDYHNIIPPRLQELVQVLEKHLGRTVQVKSYTDTGPVLERDFAQQAGLGWSGKNTCTIAPRHGSYFLLGEAFIDVEIEPDTPITTDHCGTCTRCIDHCPTNAIRLDRTIDSYRCISYQTIENKGPIAPELRSSIGNWVFGCDICQSICPWNQRFAAQEGHSTLAPRPGVPRPVLRTELQLSPEAFNRKFQGSPIQRAKRRGYLRNLAVALGNQQDTAAVPTLIQTLENEPEPLVRAHAAWALGQMRTTLARQALGKRVNHDPDPSVQTEIRAALSSLSQ